MTRKHGYERVKSIPALRVSTMKAALMRGEASTDSGKDITRSIFFSTLEQKRKTQKKNISRMCCVKPRVDQDADLMTT